MAVIDAPAGVTGTSPADLLSQTVVLARRLLLRSARTPMTLVHAVLLPVAFLFTLHYVFGKSISDATGQNALYGMVALVALLATMTGSTTGMVGISAERFDGILGANFCTGFIPLDLYPDWVQPAVRYQPMSQAVDAMRGLSVGGPVASPLTNTLLWCAGILAVCLVPIIVGYRRASTSR